MAGDDKTDNKYGHDTTPPPSYDEVQMKNVVKTDKNDEKTEEEKEKDGEEKTEEDVPPVGMLELVCQIRLQTLITNVKNNILF